MSDLPGRLCAWEASGRFFRVDGIRIWYRCVDQLGLSGVAEADTDHRHEGADDSRALVDRPDSGRPWLVCFHGFPTSSWDWHLLLPLIQANYRILIFDLPGFGLSDKPVDRDYSLLTQLDAVEALLHHMDIQQFHILSHDMGNSVVCEMLYRREQGDYPFEPLTVTLLNGGIYMDLHRPLLTQRLLRQPVIGSLTARFSSWRVFRAQYPRVYADPERFDDVHYREQWALMLHHRGRRTLARVAGYMRERVRRGSRWTRPLERLDRPLRLVWGSRDPIAVPEIAARLVRRRPQTRLLALDGVGHYPQIEAPEAVARALRERC
ncbi:alpha/beta fold hydrolase [Elongatibacter sediminis]|uniref:Alpha/beta hydrolase n=1 Tax=Elongatibacter sediminis TaxID=3119006 RepID=A0AAW9RE87_9GAMM